MGVILEPEAELLWAIFRDSVLASRLAQSPGGWRTLSEFEMSRMELTENERAAVLALQQLVQHSYPVLPKNVLTTPDDVASVYGHRLGGLVQEVMLAIGLDGAHHMLGEVELARGGLHGASLTIGDVFRPLIRMGARACILVHNHPSGDPTPSPQDIAMTEILAVAADVVDMQLVDHVIVGSRGGGFVSLFARGVIARPASAPDARHTTGLGARS